MLGIEDPQVVWAYFLCVGSAVAAVVYSFLNWDKGEAVVHVEDKHWVKEEKAVKEEL